MRTTRQARQGASSVYPSWAISAWGNRWPGGAAHALPDPFRQRRRELALLRQQHTTQQRPLQPQGPQLEVGAVQQNAQIPRGGAIVGQNQQAKELPQQSVVLYQPLPLQGVDPRQRLAVGRGEARFRIQQQQPVDGGFQGIAGAQRMGVFNSSSCSRGT